MKLEFPRQIFFWGGGASGIKFHENPPSGCPVWCGRADGQPAMTKLVVAFRNFANAPKNGISANYTVSHVQKTWIFMSVPAAE